MTHPLSDELRKLAEDYVDSPFVEALRRAADALDEVSNYHGGNALAVVRRERDELRRQVAEGDELRQEYLDDWQKEVAELRRQNNAAFDQRTEEAASWMERAERAEAQAVRYREALGWYAIEQHYVSMPGTLSPRAVFIDRGERARETLREPETGGES